MGGRRPVHDERTLNLGLEPAPEPPSDLPGSQQVSTELRHLLSRVLKECPHSRHQVAARMSELLDVDVSKHQLDAWTAESREGWRFPLEYLPAFEEACETYEVSNWLAGKRGARLLIGEEWKRAELGKFEEIREEANKQIRKLRKELGEDG